MLIVRVPSLSFLIIPLSDEPREPLQVRLSDPNNRTQCCHASSVRMWTDRLGPSLFQILFVIPVARQPGIYPRLFVQRGTPELPVAVAGPHFPRSGSRLKNGG